MEASRNSVLSGSIGSPAVGLRCAVPAYTGLSVSADDLRCDADDPLLRDLPVQERVKPRARAAGRRRVSSADRSRERHDNASKEQIATSHRCFPWSCQAVFVDVPGFAAPSSRSRSPEAAVVNGPMPDAQCSWDRSGSHAGRFSSGRSGCACLADVGREPRAAPRMCIPGESSSSPVGDENRCECPNGRLWYDRADWYQTVWLMTSQAVKIVDGGKVIIPAKFRRKLGINTGNTVVVELAEDGLHVRSLSAAVRRAQALVREFLPTKSAWRTS